MARRQIWLIVAAALVFALIFGVRQSQTLFISPLKPSTGLGIAAISLAFACGTVFFQNFFFLDWATESIVRDATIRLPFGAGRTSPVDARDVAEVVATILAHPTAHIGKVYELTGPRSQEIHAMAAEYSEALGQR